MWTKFLSESLKKWNHHLLERYKLKTHPKLIKTQQKKRGKNKTVTEIEITGQCVHKYDEKDNKWNVEVNDKWDVELKEL